MEKRGVNIKILEINKISNFKFFIYVLLLFSSLFLKTFENFIQTLIILSNSLYTSHETCVHASLILLNN